MTQQSRTTLKGYFNFGDTPTETQFADLIDSFYSKVDDTLSGSGTGTFDAIVTDITELEAELTAGTKKIYLKNGTYSLTQPFLLYSGLTLLGESQSGVILDMTGGTIYSDQSLLLHTLNGQDWSPTTSAEVSFPGLTSALSFAPDVGDIVIMNTSDSVSWVGYIVDVPQTDTLQLNAPVSLKGNVVDVSVIQSTGLIKDVYFGNMTVTGTTTIWYVDNFVIENLSFTLGSTINTGGLYHSKFRNITYLGNDAYAALNLYYCADTTMENIRMSCSTQRSSRTVIRDIYVGWGLQYQTYGCTDTIIDNYTTSGLLTIGSCHNISMRDVKADTFDMETNNKNLTLANIQYSASSQYRVVATGATLYAHDYKNIVVNSMVGNVAITLSAGASAMNGKEFVIKNQSDSTGNLILTPTTATIEGEVSKTIAMAARTAITIIAINNDWCII